MKLFHIGSCVVLMLASIARAEAPAAPDIKAVQAMITAQIELIKADKVDELKKSFSKSVQDGITAEVVTKAKKQLETMKLEEIAATAEKSESGKTVNIKMAGGRSLAKLEVEGDQWVFTKIWFK